MFWVTTLCFVFLHAALVLLIPWPDRNYRRSVVLPIALPDLYLMYGCFVLVEKVTKKAAGRRTLDTTK